MLKGYVQATPKNVKIGQKCYITNKGNAPWVHNIAKCTFGVIIGEFRDFDSKYDIAKVEVSGKYNNAMLDDDSELIEQTIYLDNLLVKVDK